MATQQTINELRQANWRHLSQTKPINNDISDMERLKIKKWDKIRQLGSATAEEGIKKWGEQKDKEARSDAMNLWYVHDLGKYVGSDAYKQSVDILNQSKQSFYNLSDDLKNATDQGMDPNLKDLILKGNPEKLKTIAALMAAKVSRDYTPFMNNQMLTSTEIVTRPDKSTFIANTAETLEDKMLAHYHFRGKYFAANNITLEGKNEGKEGLGHGYHAILKADGGPGTFESMQSQESGKSGLFAKYEIQAAISADKKRRAVASELLFNGDNFADNANNYYSVLKVGLNDKGSPLDYDKIHKIFTETIEAGLKSKHFGFTDIVDMSRSKVPGTDKTWAQLHPTKYGYDPDTGKIGSMIQYAQEAEETLYNDAIDRRKFTFKLDAQDAITAILKSSDVDGDGVTDKRDVTRKDALRMREVLHQKYGDLDVDWSEVDAAIEMHQKNPIDVRNEVNNLLEQVAKNKIRLSDRLSDISLNAREDPQIAARLREEERYMNRDDYKEAIGQIEDITDAIIKTYGLDSKVNGNLGDVKIIQHALRDKFHERVEGGMSVSQALTETQLEFKQHGGNKTLNAKDIDGKTYFSRKFSVDDDGNLLTDELKKKYVITKPEPVDVLSKIKSKVKDYQRVNGGSAIEALSNNGQNDLNVGLNFEPKPPLQLVVKAGKTPETTIYETKELAETYNKTIWETRKVPQHLLDTAQATGQDTAAVVNARLSAWGLPPLDAATEKLLGGHIAKYLPRGAHNEIFGNKTGIYHPAEISQFIMNTPDASPTEVAEVTGWGNFALSSPDDTVGNLSAAIFKGTFGDWAKKDVTDEGPLNFSTRVEESLNNPDFLPACLADPDVCDALAFFSGDTTFLLLEDGLVRWQEERQKRLHQEFRLPQRQRNYDLGNVYPNKAADAMEAVNAIEEDRDRK